MCYESGVLRVLSLVLLLGVLGCGSPAAETSAPPPAQAAEAPRNPHEGIPPAQPGGPQDRGPQAHGDMPPPPPGGHPPPPNSARDPLQGVPETAPDVQVTDLDGKAWSLKDMTAQGPVLLVIYKVECPATEMAMPAYNKFHELYGEKGYSILGIAQNSKAEVDRFRVGKRLNYPQALDADGYALSKAYNVRFTPTMALIGRDGKVKKVVTGWHREAANELAQMFATEMGQEFQPISSEDDGLPPQRPG